MAGAPGFTRTWAPSREGAWSSRAAVSALPAMDLWTAAPQGPEEPRKAPKSTHASARRVCPAGGTPPRPDGCSPIGVPESGSQSKGQRKEATCSARARSAAAPRGGGLCGSAPGTHSGPAGAPSSAGGGRLALPPHTPPSSSQASPGLSLAAGGGCTPYLPASSAARRSAQSPAPATPSPTADSHAARSAAWNPPRILSFHRCLTHSFSMGSTQDPTRGAIPSTRASPS